MTRRFATTFDLIFLCMAVALAGCSDSGSRGGGQGGDDDVGNDDDDNDNDAIGGDDDDDTGSGDSDSDGDADTDSDGDVDEDCSTCGYPVAQVYDWAVNSVVYNTEFPAIYNGQETVLSMQDVYCNSDKVKSLVFVFGRNG